jgi:hypothetical protein
MDELELIRSFESDVEASSAAREAARAALLRARGEHMKLSANPRHARLRKRTTRVRWRVGIALAIGAVATVVPLTALGLVFGGTPTPHPRLQSGPIEVSLSPSLGWTAALTSTRLRIAGAPRQVSIIIAGNFPLPRPLRPGITPLPPPGKLAIAVRHFPARGVSLRWQAVKTIRLPLREQHRIVAMHVRLGSEALLIGIRFGSAPNLERVRLANFFLAGIRNNGE